MVRSLEGPLSKKMIGPRGVSVTVRVRPALPSQVTACITTSRVSQHLQSPFDESILYEQLHAPRSAFHAGADADHDGGYAGSVQGDPRHIRFNPRRICLDGFHGFASPSRVSSSNSASSRCCSAGDPCSSLRQQFFGKLRIITESGHDVMINLRLETGRSVKVLPADLNNKADLAKVEATLRDDPKITMLINNAASS
jgi:hypothetical protein